uniref:WW domain-containing protein n=1 Tax=Oryza punctata TaxID=4537 RepID=A0A0E0JZM8_ORYPU
MEAADAADSVLHGDLLECVLLRVPHGELTASPALVSREWRRAAREAHQRHRRRRRHLPCLVAHVQGVSRSTHVYDPRVPAWASDGWSVAGALPVRRCACAGGDRVYALSLASMAVSEDAVGAAWRELPPPRVWRVDPVMAVVGPYVVVLGGGCGATAAAGVVEVLDEGAGWTTCPPMPAPLASRWVSSAASERRVYVVERRTGWASWFDPATRQWGPARQLQLPEGNNTASIESWAACGVTASGGASEQLLVLAGGGGRGGNVSLWGVDGDTLLLDAEANTSMPPEMSERLSLGAAGAGSIAAAAAGAASGYVYNASEPSKGAVRYELVDAGVGGGHDSDSKNGRHEKTWGKRSRWEWEWLPCPPAAAAAMSSSSSSSAIVVFACSRSSSAPNK